MISKLCCNNIFYYEITSPLPAVALDPAEMLTFQLWTEVAHVTLCSSLMLQIVWLIMLPCQHISSQVNTVVLSPEITKLSNITINQWLNYNTDSISYS